VVYINDCVSRWKNTKSYELFKIPWSVLDWLYENYINQLLMLCILATRATVLHALLSKHMYETVHFLNSVIVFKEFNHTRAQCDKTTGMVPFCTELLQLHMFLPPTLIEWLAVLYLSIFPFIHVTKVLRVIKGNKLLDLKGMYYNINFLWEWRMK
jgi:hypothetical protein